MLSSLLDLCLATFFHGCERLYNRAQFFSSELCHHGLQAHQGLLEIVNPNREATFFDAMLAALSLPCNQVSQLMVINVLL